MTQTITTFKRRITIQTILAFILVVFGMLVVMLALYMPPEGEIHSSVITVFGMVLVAAGAFMGIDLNFQIKPFIEAMRDKERSKSDNSHVTD